MVSFERLILGFALGCVGIFFSASAFAGLGTSADQGAALSACQAYGTSHGFNGGCAYIDGGATYTVSAASCSSGLGSQSHYAWSNPAGADSPYNYNWCVPATCTDHDSGSLTQQWGGVYENGIVYCNDGCMSVFHFQDGIGSLEFTNGDGSSWGHFVGNGNRCSSDIDASLFKSASPAPPLCDHGSLSCYNPQRGFCATSESGEQYCEQPPPPGSGSCAVGATGATCVGNNSQPPTPPDPPISKGAPPSSSGSATASNSDGTTNNYITNNYSGTSPGGGSPPSGASSGGTGSQSNSSGSGNSPGPGGSSGTDSTGKCADGSVPTASGCSGTATDTGCDTPPQCFGDAVMCGQFKEQVAIRCATQKAAAASASSGGSNYGDPSSALAQAGVPADGGASGDPSASGLVSSSDLGQDGFDASGLGFSRSCPASPQFSVLGHNYTLDLTPLCNFASLLGWFVLLCAFLVSLRIVSASRA